MIKGKIVLVPFPFDDLTAEKVRPALCLTDAISPHRHVIVAFISSQSPVAIIPTDLALSPSHKDFPATGLRVPSILRLHRVVTLTSSLIRRELGCLTPDLQREVDRKLAALFGLKSP